jgi:pimeloyl-ACP methyl ester carboxylesterase
MSSLAAPSEAVAPVLFIHGSLSSGKMWVPFANRLNRSRRVIMPDLLGYGASPPWTGDTLHLREETRRLRSAFAGHVDIVAHSYGAAVALRLLAGEPHAIRSLAAASRFVDYWNGPGAFSAMPDETKGRIASRIDKVVADFEAVGSERLHLATLRKLPHSVLVVLGEWGPAAPRLIGEAITRAMPRASSIRVRGAGHMLPSTHPAELAGILSQWLGIQPNELSRAA